MNEETDLDDLHDETSESSPENDPTEETTETAEESAEAQPEDKPEEPPQKSGVEKRIGELTWKQREAERERDYWRQQAMSQTPPEPAPAPTKTLEDFDYDEMKYQAYLFEQATARAEQGATEAARRILAEEEQNRIQMQRRQQFESSEKEYARNLADYWNVARNESLTVTQDMADVILDSDNGPAILYYLGKNPDIADQISRLPLHVAAREIGKIEAKLSTPEPEKATKAPPPPSQIKGLDPVIKKNPDDMTQAEFNAYRRKVIEQRRR